MVKTLALAYLDSWAGYVLDTDTSANSMSVVRSQSLEGHEWVVTYVSTTSIAYQGNYCVTR